jgi:hypothetical protein
MAATERERLIADLRDLLNQAEIERSHFYVGSLVRRAIAQISADAALLERYRLLDGLRRFPPPSL